MPTLFKSEPVMVVAVVLAVLAVVAGRLLNEDPTAIAQAVVSIAILIGGAFARQQVSPAHKVEDAALDAYRQIDAANHPGNPFGPSYPGDDVGGA